MNSTTGAVYMDVKTRWHLPLIGLIQGIILAIIYYNFDFEAPVPLALRLVIDVVVLAPVLFYATEAIDGLSQRSRAIIIGGLILLTIAVFEYNTWVFAPTEAPSWRPQTVGPMLVFLFIATHLLMHWSVFNPTHHAYRDLYKSTWRNAILCLLAVVLTQLFWMILFAGAELFKLIGIKELRDLISKPWFNMPATTAVFSVVIATALLRHESFENLRRLLLGLLKWFLPLVLLLAAVWVVCLPFTGITGIFKNRSAAWIMLPTVALSVLFINAAYQDGDEDAPYQTRISQLMKWLWLALIPVSLIALWAFYLRVSEYSWTSERLWGTFVTLLAITYAIGYSVSVLRPRSATWMPTIARTNRIAAVITCIGIIAFLTPLLDGRRIEANAQLKRTLAMKAMPERGNIMKFLGTGLDLKFTEENGRFGLAALNQLTAPNAPFVSKDVAAGVKRDEDKIRRRIADRLKPRDKSSDDGSKVRIDVVNAEAVNAPLDAALRKRIADKQDNVDMFLCTEGTGCTIWWQDLNGDGQSEAIIFGNDSKVMAHVYVLVDNEPKQIGMLQPADLVRGPATTDLFESVKSGNAELVPNPWKRVRVGNDEYELK